MDGLVAINCSHCGQETFKEPRHVNENIKLGNNFYCSRECQYQHRTVRRHSLQCENRACGKTIIRRGAEILEHTYCSTSCAAIVNNKRFPKPSRAIIKICENRKCRKVFKGGQTLYCSNECWRSVRRKYTEEELISKIQRTVKEFGRIPAKREMKGIHGACVVAFGSWNNAIVAAGFTPNRSQDDRMYKRTKTKASDGHECDSVSEAIVDNWLTDHGIDHERNIAYPSTNHKADWGIENNTIFVEYFGLAKESPRYDRAIKEKKALCERYGITLIELYPKDLYPTTRLSGKFAIYSHISRDMQLFDVPSHSLEYKR